MVELPQRPLVETMRVPDGRGGELVEEDDVRDEVDDVDGDGVGVGVGVGVGMGVGVGVGVSLGALPHRPNCGWQPTRASQ